MEVSVVIATYNRCDLLEKLLDSLEDQTMPHDSYEVIVCDSNSSDNTQAMVLSKRQKFANIHYVNIEANSGAAKRNVAFKQAKGKIVVALDDDMLVGKNFLETHYQAHKQSTKTVFCGQVRFPKAFTEQSNYFRFKDSRHLGPSRPEIDSRNIPYRMFVIMNLSFKRTEMLETVGFISEQFTRYGFEDEEYGYRIAQAGFSIQYLETALADHYEAKGCAELFFKKIYVTSRDSAPVLHGLVPGSASTSGYANFEPILPSDPLPKRLLKGVLGLLTAKVVYLPIKAFLSVTDAIPQLYFPVLYRYLTAAAYAQGARDRSKAVARRGWID
jgi:glycosyltransferase involved in cell wall biosynthesis